MIKCKTDSYLTGSSFLPVLIIIKYLTELSHLLVDGYEIEVNTSKRSHLSLKGFSAKDKSGKIIFIQILYRKKVTMCPMCQKYKYFLITSLKIFFIEKLFYKVFIQPLKLYIH